jgi:addiction module RelE/StbE family toxin
MVGISWTEQAIDDVEKICEFIARDSPGYAKIFAHKVYSSVDRLRKFPRSGRIVPELEIRSVREIIFGNYRIIYRIKKSEIDILTVYHSSRILDPLQL